MLLLDHIIDKNRLFYIKVSPQCCVKWIEINGIKKTNFEVHDIDKYIVERKIQEILAKTFFIYITQAKRSFCGPF